MNPALVFFLGALAIVAIGTTLAWISDRMVLDE